MTAIQGLPAPAAPPPGRDGKLMEAAKALEASFLAEMLKSAGFGKARDAFGGGTGEDQFASLMIREQADRIVAAGGIGLAEQLFEAMKKEAGHGSV